MSNLENKKLEDFNFEHDSFELVSENKKIYDQKFDTKPTTYLKDAFKRFCKNKSSVAGAFILGILILLAIFVPMLSPYEIKEPRVPERMLAPKLFNSGFGFWDGTKKMKNIVYDLEGEKPSDTYLPAVSDLVVDTAPSYINSAHKYAKGGYLHFINETKPFLDNPEGINFLYSSSTTMTADGGYVLSVVMGDEDNLNDAKLGEYRILLKYQNEGMEEEGAIVLQDYSTDYSDVEINISQYLSNSGITSAQNAKVYFELKGHLDYDTYILIEKCVVTSTEENPDLKTLSIYDANASVQYATDAATGKLVYGAWTSDGKKNIYKAIVYYCSFSYDTYLAAYDKYEKDIAFSTMQDYIKAGYCTLEIDAKNNTIKFERLTKDCPVEKVVGFKKNSIGKITELTVEIYRYREYGYKTMPRFLFGTDTSGHDLVKKAFAGLRTSLVLGVCTFLFCFVFGLCWGAISGYFGGNVDLAMERFCDILGGVPWIVVMTLCILHFGSNFGTFFLALCLTGWMGTAARTRTQFYRFKGREYVLASRTLGASDMRLVFRHILPNSLGTIVTGAVLMIPSVIFSESTLAYLNLGLRNMQSFGVMLSDNQKYISTDAHLIMFPATILALIMISFNLFGNGLRDALNPSLKGSE